MEWIKATITDSRSMDLDNITSEHLACCSFHKISFGHNNRDRFHSFNYEREYVLPEKLKKITSCCRKEPDSCQFYLLALSGELYKLDLNLSKEAPKKRAKLSERSRESPQKERDLSLIDKDIAHIVLYRPNHLLLFKPHGVLSLNASNGSFHDHSLFSPKDKTITSCEYVEKFEPIFVDFFSLDSQHGLLFSKDDGIVYWRNMENKALVQDLKLFSFEAREKVVMIQVISTPSSSQALFVIGDQGTIMLYSKSSKAGLLFNQFNINGPVHSVDRINSDSILVSVGSGRIYVLTFQFEHEDISLDLKRVHGISNARYIQILDANDHIFEAILVDEKNNNAAMVQAKYDPNPTNVENDSKAIEELIRDTLEDLAHSESIVKSMEIEEQEINEKLSSINRTLYALHSINNKRVLGQCNSIDSTGFEFTVQPIVKSNSFENCILNSKACLRLCIKTSRFLELENWTLQLDFSSELDKSCGQTKLFSVIGFEAYYENGIERYAIWEHDAELDIKTLILPLNMQATLVMTTNDSGEIARFPVANMIIDDLHFAIPLSNSLNTSIKRRGLDKVSDQLMHAYQQRRLYDKSSRDPLSRLIRRQRNTPEQKHLLDHRSIHFRYTIDAMFSDEAYRSILSTLFGEGRTINDLKQMLLSAEQSSFALVSYPGCPVIVELSRVSSTVIEIKINCSYTPALFKAEATILRRVQTNYKETSLSKDQGDINLVNKLKKLQETILELQEDCMETDEDDSLWTRLKSAIDMYYSLHNDIPIGHLE